MLRVENVRKSFDGVEALRGLTMHFEAGKVYAIIGPNGAGKTTLFNVINGLTIPDEGKVFIRGKDVTGSPPYRIAKEGVGRLFQDIKTFPRMRLVDNLMISKKFKGEENPLASLMRIIPNRREEKIHQEGAKHCLDELGIILNGNPFAENLSFGQEKLLSLGRLIMGGFDILLLDEPTAGIHPRIKSIIYRKIRQAALQGKLVILVEHEMEAVRKSADLVYFLSGGRVEKMGTTEEILADKKVRMEYLGFNEAVGKKEKLSLMGTDNPGEILKTEGIYAGYNKREVLRDVSIKIGEEEIVALIGPNGAGKSTLLRVLAGMLLATRGKITYRGKDITNLSTRERVGIGIGYFMQGGEIFTDLTVQENLNIAAIKMLAEEVSKQRELLFDLFPVLLGRINERAGLLSRGERQMLALAMVLMRKPRVLIWLDEPSAGLSPRLSKEMAGKVDEIRKKLSISILLVEQRIGDALALADRVYILKEGQIQMECTPDNAGDEILQSIFLGGANED